MPPRQRYANEQEAIDNHYCSECFAKRGEPCVFMEPKHRVNPTSPSGRALLERVGREMTTVHAPRRKLHSAAHYKRLRAMQDRAAKESQPAWLPALRQFDLMERAQMQDFLRTNYRLFGLKRRI